MNVNASGKLSLYGTNNRPSTGPDDIYDEFDNGRSNTGPDAVVDEFDNSRSRSGAGSPARRSAAGTSDRVRTSATAIPNAANRPKSTGIAPPTPRALAQGWQKWSAGRGAAQAPQT